MKRLAMQRNFMNEDWVFDRCLGLRGCVLGLCKIRGRVDVARARRGKKWLPAAAAVVLAAAGVPPAQGQRVLLVPPNLQAELDAQGDRFASKGKERVVVAGQLTGANGVSKPVSLVRDIRGRFRLVFPKHVVAFDGTRESSSGGALSAEDLAAAESLIDDSVEAFFASVDRGDALRLIGRRFPADEAAASGAEGGTWHDIYELRWRGRGGSAAVDRVKFFYFDSDTGLPARVRYVSAAGEVETLMGQWRQAAGQHFPLAVVRMAAGRRRLSFFAQRIVLDADKADGAFTAGN